MYSRINYTVVGLFVMLFMAGVLAFGFWLARFGFDKKYDNYITYFHESVSGLAVDSSVKLNGVDVGKVSSIEIVPENPLLVRVGLRLASGTPITKDMYTTLKPEGVTGLSFVDIVGGDKKSEIVKTGRENAAIIPSKRSLIGDLTLKVPDLLESIKTTIDKFEEILSEKNRNNLEKIMENTSLATKKMLEVENRIVKLSDDFNATMNSFSKKMDPVFKSINKAGRSTAKLADSINRKVHSGEFDIKSAIQPLKTDLQELSYRYQELAEELKTLTRHPSSLIFGGTKPPRGPGE